MTENPALLSQYFVLAVLLAPLLAALLCANTRGSARRLAVGLGLLHVGLTAGLVALTVGALLHRGEQAALGRWGPDRFQPLAVPGNTSPAADADGYETTWTLLPLAPTGPGLPPAGVQLYLGVDGLNVWLVALASVMTLVAVLASWHHPGRGRAGFLGWLFLLQFGLTGAFLAFDVVLFYVFFELTLVPAFFLIGRYGVGGGRREAARQFVVYTLFGSLLTLAGAVGLVLTNPTPVRATGAPDPAYLLTVGPEGTVPIPAEGPVTFSLPALMNNVRTWGLVGQFEVWRAESAAEQAAGTPEAGRRRAEADAAHAKRDRRRLVQLGLFALLVAGFAVKTPIVPFHSWLPAAYGEAPLGATLLFSAVLAKLGTYGLLRLVLPLCPEAVAEHGLAVFGTLGAVGILYAAFCAYAQPDLKLLAAYSSVSHLGFVVLGLMAANVEGVTGAALHMVNHGLTAGGLFAVLAVLHDRYGTTHHGRISGLAARLPGFAVLTMVISLAGVGLPGLNSFVSEMLLMAGLFDPALRPAGARWLAAAAAAGLFLSAWYTITMLRRVLFGPLREPDGLPAAPLSRPERFALGIPAALCLLLGLFPQPVLDSVRGDAGVVVRQVDAARERLGRRPPPVPPAVARPPADGPPPGFVPPVGPR